MRTLVTLIAFLVSVTTVAADKVADRPTDNLNDKLTDSLTIDQVKSFRDGTLFSAEFSYKGSWAIQDLDVNFTAETIQIDLPRATFSKGKNLVRLEDPFVKSVYITQSQAEVVRVRITLNKGFSARSLEDSLSFQQKEGVFAIQISGNAQKTAGKKALENTRTYPIVQNASTTVADGASEEESPKLIVSEDSTIKAEMAKAALASNAEEAKTALEEIKPKVDVNKAAEKEIPVLTDSKADKKTANTSVQRLLMSLGVIILILAGTAFGLKRWSKTSKGRNENTKIKVLTQHHLGAKKSLVIVQVAGESLLIGVTDQNISMLKTLALLDEEIPEEVPRSFSNSLSNFVEEQEEYEAPPTKGKKRKDNIDDFAMRGLSEIRDTVSTRLKNMRQF